MNKKHITNDILPNQTYQNNKIVMNKTQQLLKSREEEFDKEFPQEDFREDMNDSERQEYFFLRDVKSFHATTISLLLNSLKEEVLEFRYKIKPQEEHWLYGVTPNSATEAMTLKQEYEKSIIPDKRYNQAIDNVLTLLSQTISNIPK